MIKKHLKQTMTRFSGPDLVTKLPSSVAMLVSRLPLCSGTVKYALSSTINFLNKSYCMHLDHTTDLYVGDMSKCDENEEK